MGVIPSARPVDRPPGRAAGAPDRWLRPLGWASLVANIVLVVTGGAVRLTGSGLGCPTWPRCTDRAFTPHGAYSVHSVIEFGNRMLTFVLVAVAVATFVAAWRSGRRELRRAAGGAEQIAAAVATLVPDRNVGGMPIRGGQRQSDDRGAHGRNLVGDDAPGRARVRVPRRGLRPGLRARHGRDRPAR